jgi:signal transduction histidine kinase
VPLRASNPRSAPRRLLYACTALVIVVLLATNAAVILYLREAELAGEEDQLRRISLTLAEQADRAFQSVDLIVSSVAARMAADGVSDSASFLQKMAGEGVHLYLEGKIAGIPQLAAVALISREGDIINASPSWAIHQDNVADRDYFRVLKDDMSQNSYIGIPLENRGTETWTIPFAHRLNGVNGEFIGIILASVKTSYFDEFYRAISFGDGNGVALQRLDGVLLARFPKIDIAGRVSSQSRTVLGGRSSGTTRGVSPITGKMRLMAVRRLSEYPLLTLATKGEWEALTNWRNMARVLSMNAVGCSLLTLVVGLGLGRFSRQRSALADAQQDIAEQRRAEQTLRTSQQRFREFAEVASDRLWEMGPDLRFISIADRTAAIGRPPSLFLGNRAESILDASVDPVGVPALLAALESRKPIRDQRFRVSAGDGKRFHLKINATPILDAEGVFQGYRGATLDETEVVEAAERLGHAQRMESVGQVASGLAHELNSLLQPIVSMAEMAREDHQEDVDLTEAMTVILDSANRAAAIVQDMLLYVRHPSKERGLVWLADVVTSELDALRRILPAGIRLNLRTEVAVGKVRIASGELGQIIKNLLRNAVQALSGHGVVTISVDEVEVANSQVLAMQTGEGRDGRIVVSDDGPGIAPALLGRVFEPFFTTKDIGQGTGLGLSIVQGIVRSSGGTITVRNLPQGGAAFEILLPSFDVPAAPAAAGAPEDAPGDSAGPEAELRRRNKVAT